MDFHPGTNPEVFETRILEKSEGFLYLEETYCYPRGGGQPGDRGLMINSDGQSSFPRSSSWRNDQTPSC